MFDSISHASIYVTDQEKALDFYVGKLGLEVRADVDMEVMRWLTLGVPGQDDFQILIETPIESFVGEESVNQIEGLLSKGALGLGFILNTDDCRKTFAELVEKGVEVTDEPKDRFYGVDCGIRDPFGNAIRITEPKDPADWEEPSWESSGN
jgi:catechol 2,3-dioxygenase-like lactoylglutathione lyase family enzyme